MPRIQIRKGTRIQRLVKNNPAERQWVELVGDVTIDEAEYVHGAYLYAIDRQTYTVPASMAEVIALKGEAL